MGRYGDQRDVRVILSNEKVLKKLPLEYTEIRPAYLPPTICVPESHEILREVTEVTGIDDDNEWLTAVRTKDAETSTDISWAAYHAKHTQARNDFADLSALLPMWRDASKSPAMIKHALMVIARAVEFLNPGQTPVVTFDQPLYAIAKGLQWHYRNQCDKNHFVIMLGPLQFTQRWLSLVH